VLRFARQQGLAIRIGVLDRATYVRATLLVGICCLAAGWAIASGNNAILLVACLPLIVGVVWLLVSRPYFVFCLQILVLSTTPVLRVYAVGDVPVYLVDVLMILTVVGLLFRERRREWPYTSSWVRLCIWVFLGASVVSSASLALTTGAYAEVIYALIRHLLLTLGMFYAVGHLADTSARQKTLLQIVVVGALINAIFAVMQNLPGAQAVGAQIPFDLYGGERTQSIQRFEEILAGQYRRGYGFFQAATTLGGFLSLAVVLVGLSRRSIISSSWLRILFLVIITAGILATYTRHAVVTLILSLVVLLIFAARGRSAVFRVALAGTVLGVGLFALNIVDLSIFSARTELLVNYQDDAGIMSRIERLSSFADYATQNPVRLLIGNGTGISDLRDRALLEFDNERLLRSGFVSNSYPLMIYNLGLLGFLAYFGLFGATIYQAFHKLWSREKAVNGLLLGLSAALVVAAFLHFFDNYLAESTQMKAVMWFLLGMTLKVTETDAESAVDANTRPNAILANEHDVSLILDQTQARWQ
jgi:hypothetical protein